MKLKPPKNSDIPRDGCLNACVAFLFGLSCKDVPRFDLARDGIEQSRLLQQWLRPRKLFLVELEDHKHVPALHIACGPIKGDNKNWHAVVCQGRKLIYNPDEDVKLSSIWERFVIAPIHWLEGLKHHKIATQQRKKRSKLKRAR